MNWMHMMAVESFAPMLESLSAILDKGAYFAKGRNIDLPNARLAPDMFTLGQQVQQACFYAENGVARLAGRDPVDVREAATTLASLQKQIAATLASVRGVSAAEFNGAETRDCSIDLPNDKVIEMNGLRFLKSWSLPHFYFHVVTAFDILRHSDVNIGKMDYHSQVKDYIRPKAA
jgi:hypothetical protein